ncbi:MAG: hypothetical protein HBSAPP03_06690 [Phycisphaerae bacterium]|nr:MAG: hypothetical protein HBSAPP03_06690 [Phycisphaerae bacterium]
MRRTRTAVLTAALLAAAAGVTAGTAHAQTNAGTGFTYQGELKENGQLANGVFDLQFTLYTAAVGGSQVGFSQVVENVPVTNGKFSTKVDFGYNWNGQARWLQIGARQGVSVGPFTPMLPRQEVTPAPYAVSLALPHSQSQSNTLALFNLINTGTGHAMNLAASSGSALVASTSGGGDALDVSAAGAGDGVYTRTTGTGHAVNASASGAGSGILATASGTGYGVQALGSGTANAFFGYSLGTSGRAGLFRTENQNNGSTTLEIQQNGAGTGLYATARAGYAAHFENTNVASSWVPLRVTNVGSGSALWARNNGTGRGALIEIGNASSTANALEVYNNGNGLAAKFSGGDVQIWGRAYATIGTVLNRATPVAWGTFEPLLNNPTFTTSSGNVSITSQGGGLYVVTVVGEGDPSNWTVVTSVSYDNPSSPQRTYAVRAGKPQAIAGQPGNGSVRLHIRCIEGCDNQFATSSFIDFVVYKGM